jgi:hypothetical protein
MDVNALLFSTALLLAVLAAAALGAWLKHVCEEQQKRDGKKASEGPPDDAASSAGSNMA